MWGERRRRSERLRDDRWGINRRELETTVDSITDCPRDADMVIVHFADGQSINCSRAYLCDPHTMERLFEEHDLVVRIESRKVVRMLVDLDIDTAGWFARKRGA